MAWTTPGTATAGEVLTAAFWNTQVRDNMLMLAPFMSTWTTYQPTISQGATTNIATSTKEGGYIQIGKTVFGYFRIVMSGGGTAGSSVSFSLPVTQKNEQAVIGSAWIYDNSTATRYACILEAKSGSEFIFVGDWAGAAAWGSSPNIGIASGDQFRGHFTYEAL